MTNERIMNDKYGMINEEGFVALISVVIISAILLIVATTLSFSGFYGRFNILESEFKERSVALADACADTALLIVAQGTSVTTPYLVTISGNDKCVIKTADTVSDPSVFNIQAIYQNAYTNLEIKIKKSDQTIVSWTELLKL